VTGQTIRPSQAVIIQLINLVRKQATTAEIEEICSSVTPPVFQPCGGGVLAARHHAGRAAGKSPGIGGPAPAGDRCPAARHRRASRRSWSSPRPVKPRRRRAFARVADELHLSNRQVNWAHLQALAWAENTELLRRETKKGSEQRSPFCLRGATRPPCKRRTQPRGWCCACNALSRSRATWV
jgi:hypothetical protein